MKPNGTVEYNSLSWVKQQLDTVINDAQTSLSEYIENNDETLMQDCIEGLRLVCGTLQMVEVFGAAMLAEEMELTAKAILEDKVEHREDAYDVLMRAMLHLPDYLEGLQSGNRDTPMVLLPLMNDMRTIRKESLLSESVLFFPDIDAVDVEEKEIEAPHIEAGKLHGEARRLRTHFQLGLLDLLKNDRAHAGCQRMLAVVASLEKASASQSVRRFWSVVAALLEGLSDEGIDPNVSVKMLLGGADRQIKLLIDVGEDEFAAQYSQDLLKNVLYYVGNSKTEGKRIARVKEMYNLDELLLAAGDDAEAAVGGLNAELFATVSQGIKEDLVKVKDALEIFVHSNERDTAGLQPLLDLLLRIGDTYGMLGLGDARARVLQQRDKIQSIVGGGADIDEEAVFAIAEELLSAEADLDNYVAQRSGALDVVVDENGVVPAAEYREVLATVIAQGLENFTEAKDAILSFTSGAGESSQLEAVLNLLEEARGVSMMLPMAQVEAMIVRLQNYVRVALLDNGHQPDAEEQDKIADVVTAIEYFFEAMSEGRPGVEAGLRTGEEALKALDEVFERYESVAPSRHADQGSDEGVEKKPITNEIASSAEMADVVELHQADIRKNAPTEIDKGPTPDEEYGEFEILGGDVDTEILGIFIEEALEVLEELQTNLPQWKADLDDEDALTVVRRCFHTLKGSGRLVGAQLIGEFSWKFENMLNRVIDKKIEPGDDVLNALDEAVAALPGLIDQLKGNREPVRHVYQLMANADALAEGRELASAPVTPPAASVEPLPLEEPVEDSISMELDISELQPEDDDALIDTADASSDSAASGPAVTAAEAGFEGVEPIPEDGSQAQPDPAHLTPGDGEPDAEAALSLPDDGEHESVELVDEDSVGVIDLSGEDELLTVEGFDFEIDEEDDAQEPAETMTGGMDPVLFQIYYDESTGHLDLVRQLLDAHKQNHRPLAADKDLVRAFHTLYGSARTADIDQVAELCGAAEKYIRTRQEAGDTTISEDVVRLITDTTEKVQAMLDSIKSGEVPAYDKVLLERMNKAIQSELQEQLQLSTSYSDEGEEDSTEEVVLEQDAVDLPAQQGAEQAETASGTGRDATGVQAQPEEHDRPESAAEPEQAAIAYGEIDSDLIDIFIEEADELIESCEDILQKIINNPDDVDSIHQLQRYMHTLKGGARMAELTPVGDLTHLLESLVIRVSDKQVKADKLLFDTLNEAVDRLAVMLKNVKDRAPIDTASDLVAQLEALKRGEVPEKRAVERYDIELDDLSATKQIEEQFSEQKPAEEQDQGGQIKPGPNFGRRASDREEKPQWGERATDTNYRDTQELIRVRADLLNDLVNHAGEVSIHHARMGKQMSDISFNLNELEATVVRLKQQLRNLEIETEIQIRSSFEKESDQYDDDFDPLEMDRYSTIQQLSRSLTETAGDVESIREILSDIVRDSEKLLLQESRVSTELQEGLMRTRMVRFGGLSTRLRRIVRQTSRELGKEVELSVFGDSNELDRTVLDRIIAPLEHMLRNAVAHGIEAPDKRLAAGKPETGRITIMVDRQGADVVLKISDDGAGINAGAVRNKAIKQGLLDADSKVSDREVLQFILKSGFSTAETVSQVAGRGVGMDVVDSELKQLGGVLEIDTIPGRGTEFTIRLPLTLAINQALLVSAADDVYAIPLASIEGVVRVTGAELQRFYRSDNRLYEFNNVNYELRHLGQLLTGQRPDYSEQYGLFPVLLTQVGNSHFALHVDELVGRREIVVKPVGHQIGMVRGIAGATILADGRVVLILEMSALVVGDSLFREPQHDEVVPEEVVPEKVEARRIMVVDDSITIRKVTARMLERNGIQVMLAKDGIDATNQLIDTKPDLMLLDIEMPRMDGFELATYIRNDERLRDLPIIMITSRTGEKHKEKAREIGVNRYLGKPYQEEELLRNINDILEA